VKNNILTDITAFRTIPPQKHTKNNNKTTTTNKQQQQTPNGFI